MKTKLYLLVLFFSGFSGFAFSPPVITNPTALQVCDQNSDGFESFDLTVKIPEILGSLNPSSYSVYFYETQADAETGANPIFNTISYYNINPFAQSVYIRVSDNITAEYSITSLVLIVNPLPNINPSITDYYINDFPFDGSATFNLTSKDIEIVFGDPGLYVTYYPTLVDALVNANVLANPTNYTNVTNPQTIGVRVDNPVTGCSQTSSFQIIVNSTGLPIVTPSDYRVCDVGNDTSENFDLTSKNAEILDNLYPPLYTVNYYLTSQDSINDVNVITNPSVYPLNTTTAIVYARVFENANPANFALTSLWLKIVPMPTGTIAGPTSVCQGELAAITFVGANSAQPYSFYYNIDSVSGGVATASLGNTVSIQINTLIPGNYIYDLVAVLSQNEAYCYNSQSGSVNVEVLPAPPLSSAIQNIYVEDIPYDGVATFNITFNETAILNGQTGATIAYYSNQLDAQAENSPILTPTAYIGNNGQDIWFRVNYATGCPLISGFRLYTTNPDIVFIPDPNFKAKLIEIGVDTNNDGEIQVTEAQAVINLPINNALISDLTGIQSFTNLQNLNCDANNISDITLTGLSALTTLSCNSCSLTSLNLTNLNLQTLYCQNNNLTNLDLSTITLENLYATSNPNLLSINLKNGSIEQFLDILNGNGALRFVCVDPGEENYILNLINILGIPNTIAVNSYCSFTPSGNFNTITGNVIFDANNNGCDASDDIQPNIRVDINDGTSQGAFYTNASGSYSFYTPAGDFELTPSLDNSAWFNFSPATASISFADNNNNTTTQNFCMTANGVHRDVEMVIVPITPARPGFDAEYRLVYRNKGNQTVDVYPNFSYNDNLLDLVSTSVVPFQTNVGGISWVIPNILPFQSGSIDIVLNVNAPTDTPAVNNGDILTFTSFIDITGTDENWDDNSFSLNQTVVGSFDPNDITCLEGEVVSPTEIGNYLHYNIRFENTGTFQAENIVVKDIIDDSQFDVSTLQVMNNSNPVKARLTGNVAEFIFQNINLQAGGHGNILLKIKSKNTLVQGDTISKKAAIYFDYNFPIDTNMAVTTFQALSNPSFPIDATITIYPNPTKNNIYINSKNNINSIELYDVQGRILETNLVNDIAKTIDLSTKQIGIYFIKVTTDKGMKVEKIMKE